MNNIKYILNVYKARFIISLKIYIRYPINFLMNFFMPIMWIAPFYFMGKGFTKNGNLPGFEYYAGNSDYIGFIVVGYIISSILISTLWGMGFSIKEEMQQGVLESNWSAPINKIHLIVGKSLYNYFITFLEIVITIIVCHFAFNFNINGNMLKAILIIIISIIGFYGLGIIIASLVLLAKNANPIIDMSNSLISGLSGSFFPIKVFPKGILFISLLIPLTYVYDTTRYFLISQKSLFNIKFEIIILIITSLLLLIIGNIVFKKIETKCLEEGRLSGH
ncbi:ABC transporter permease [Oceanotoga sp. DSM 15011]|uniref:Transport permease protein n=1 Tax=Oceanotoga teriensis TaxID=515440 RepID=A0AA45C4J0_9BACT|nr:MULTISPECIES: ABC transporter permease [Oceanotoga]MDN5341807.1 type transport system permease protein [Oceanotoga sp.]MDO7975720.1 ABC transporter permease [Oceanotoga teriensis]PWJ86062.1 ABC-2 type transport system permease protein [Oceanotoga teriensis]UYO99776.1 ABC transporter permease [Oceanotoga sp. DSM 15011]